MKSAEIIKEIDSTLDLLTQNTKALDGVQFSELSPIEKSAFQKTQESLLAHLISLDDLLKEKNPYRPHSYRPLVSSQRKEKIEELEKLAQRVQRQVRSSR